MFTIFETPGIFDLESVRTFGLNAKPNSTNPIGFFGTGLKYAIAVLLRHNAKLTIYSDGNEYKFYTKDRDFRGQTFSKVRYRHTNAIFNIGRYQDLDYTTELGKNWQLWQAFRELYANTLDEDGIVYTSDHYNPTGFKSSLTYIIIDHHEFARLVDTKDQIFLPKDTKPIAEHYSGIVAKGKSSHLYYRGMRAFDLPEDKPAMHTYNITAPIELTEDRTIKNQYSYRSKVEDIISQSTDHTLIREVLTAPAKTFEADLNFEYAYGHSEEFKKVLTDLNRSKVSYNPTAQRYFSANIAPKVPDKSIDTEVWNRILKALKQGMYDAYNTNQHLNVIDNDEKIRSLYENAFREEFDRPKPSDTGTGTYEDAIPF